MKGVLDVTEDANTQMAAMQAQFEETIAKLHEDFTARLRVLEASNKSMWYSWYGGQRRDDGRDDGIVSGNGGMPRQQQLQQHWSRDGGLPRQQQQQQWSRGGGIAHQHQRSSHVFPPARQVRQQQPLQRPSRGIPTIGGDGEDGSTPLSETFFGGNGGAVEEWLQSGNIVMPMFSLSEGTQQSTPTAVALAATAPVAEAVTGTSIFPAVSSKGMVETSTSSIGVASAAVPAAEAAPLTGDTAAPDASVERVAKELTLEAGSSSEICGERGASTHPFDPGTGFPLEVSYYKGSWLQHGNSSSSKSNSSSSSSNSNDNTSNHDSWWDATCVGAQLRPFDPGKRCRRSARIGKAVLDLDLPFDRERAWRRMQHGG